MSSWRRRSVEALSQSSHDHRPPGPPIDAVNADPCKSGVVTVRNTINRPVRRSLAAAAVGVLVIGLTAACGGSDPKASAEQEELGEGESISITTFGEFGYDALIDQWNTEHPDIQVEQTKVS